MIVKLYLVVCNLSGEGGRGEGGGEKKAAGERRVHTMVLQGGGSARPAKDAFYRSRCLL